MTLTDKEIQRATSANYWHGRDVERQSQKKRMNWISLMGAAVGVGITAGSMLTDSDKGVVIGLGVLAGDAICYIPYKIAGYFELRRQRKIREEAGK